AAGAAATPSAVSGGVVGDGAEECQADRRYTDDGPETSSHCFAPFVAGVACPYRGKPAAKGILFPLAGGVNVKRDSGASGARFQLMNWARNCGCPGAFGYVRTRCCGSG